VETFVVEKNPCQHVVVNVDKIVKANRDPRLLEIINRCDLINADGMPVVWASRLLGHPLKERVAGIDLFLALVERAAVNGWGVYFLGAREDVLAEAVGVLVAQCPKLKVVGRRSGYWAADEEHTVVEMIRAARPDLLFVAISSPQKERFLGQYARELSIPFSMGVGGSFDVVAGRTRRAPLWMQRTGLEWFFRFLQEPRRMFRRYFIDDPYFLVLLWRAWKKREK
jgi:N-acetylglucosaminyldiphosphoundecaprenol N-acetyl-beta-D-mannosaminyltransferase